MTSRHRRVLVSGATGTVGQAVALALARAGWGVRALVRDPSRPSTFALINGGIDLRQGDFDRTSTLLRSMQGIDTAVLITGMAGADYARAEAHAWNLGMSALRSGVGHVLQVSMYGASLSAASAHLVAHARIENMYATLGLSHTVLRPGLLMENLRDAFPPVRQAGALRFCLPAPMAQPIPLVALDDVSAAVVTLLETHARPERVDLIGDTPSLGDICAAMSAILGEPVVAHGMVHSEGRSSPLADLLAVWASTVSDADVTQRQYCPTDFASWLARARQRN